MAKSIKDLKKNINYIFSDIIETCYIIDASKGQSTSADTEAVITEAITNFDDLMKKVNTKVENKKAHFKAINEELEANVNVLIEKVNKLS
jgi:hypothetical protein